MDEHTKTTVRIDGLHEFADYVGVSEIAGYAGLHDVPFIAKLGLRLRESFRRNVGEHQIMRPAEVAGAGDAHAAAAAGHYGKSSIDRWFHDAALWIRKLSRCLSSRSPS
jgi:hypothetical protein